MGRPRSVDSVLSRRRATRLWTSRFTAPPVAVRAGELVALDAARAPPLSPLLRSCTCATEGVHCGGAGVSTTPRRHVQEVL